jgi:hypothetical protein
MRLTIVRWLLALLALLAACGPNYDGGGRRPELPGGGAAGQAGTGAGGIGLSGSSDSGGRGGQGGFDADVPADCPVDAGYMIDTGFDCITAFPVGTTCRRDDGAECVCSAQSLTWDCR